MAADTSVPATRLATRLVDESGAELALVEGAAVPLARGTVVRFGEPPADGSVVASRVELGDGGLTVVVVVKDPSAARSDPYIVEA